MVREILSGMVAGKNVELLLIHYREDAEVPHAVSAEVAASFPRATLKTTNGLGHRRIVKSPEIIQDALAFILA